MKLIKLIIFLIVPIRVSAEEQIIWVLEAANYFSQVSYEQCLEAKEIFLTDVLPQARKDVPAYISKHAQDSFGHFCEAKRHLLVRVPAYERVIVDYAQKAAELEEKWQQAHELDPEKFLDFEGRDQAQQGLYASIRGANINIEMHRRESKRLFNLALADLVIASNGDPDAADDIIRRMLGTLPPSQTIAS